MVASPALSMSLSTEAFHELYGGRRQVGATPVIEVMTCWVWLIWLATADALNVVRSGWV
jgi:hypothetical protein